MPTPHVETVKIDELDCWRIRHNGAELMVAQQGAHIFSYGRDGEQPLIWPNPEAVFKQGKGIRTGVPVCWPWFGVFDRNPQSVKAMRQSDQPAGAHISVLLAEAIDALFETALPTGRIWVDGTFGRGGHTRAILSRMEAADRLVVIDRDPEAIEVARILAETDDRVIVVHGSWETAVEELARRGIERCTVFCSTSASRPRSLKTVFVVSVSGWTVHWTCGWILAQVRARRRG